MANCSQRAPVDKRDLPESLGVYLGWKQQSLLHC